MPGGKRNRGKKTNRAIKNLQAGLERAESEQQSEGLKTNMDSPQLQDSDDQDNDTNDGDEGGDSSPIDNDEVGAGNGKPEGTVTDTPTERSGTETGYTGKGKAAVCPTEAAEPQTESVGDETPAISPDPPAISSDTPANPSDSPAIASDSPANAPNPQEVPTTASPAPTAPVATPAPAPIGPSTRQLAPHQRKWEDLTWEEQMSANKLSLKKKPITAKKPQRFTIKRTVGANLKQGIENAEAAIKPDPLKASLEQVARPDSSQGPVPPSLAHNTPFVTQPMNKSADIEEDDLAKEARLLNENKDLKIARLEQDVEKWYETAMEERTEKERVQNENVAQRKELHAIKHNGKTDLMMKEMLSQNKKIEAELKQANGNLVEHRHHSMKLNKQRDADKVKIENLDKAVTAAQSELRDKLQEAEGLQRHLDEAAFDIGELHRHIDQLETATLHAQGLEKENAELKDQIRSVHAGLEETFSGMARGLDIAEQLGQIRDLQRDRSPPRSGNSSIMVSKKNQDPKRVVSLQDELGELGEDLSDKDDEDDEEEADEGADEILAEPVHTPTDAKPARTPIITRETQTESGPSRPPAPTTVEVGTQTDPSPAGPDPVILYGLRPVFPPATITAAPSGVPVWLSFILALLAFSAAVLCLDLIREKAVWAAANDLTYDRLMGISDESWLDWVVLGVSEVTSEVTSELMGSPMARSLFG